MEFVIMSMADFNSFRSELINEIKSFVQPQFEQKLWLKSAEVMEILGCSPGTLQNLRVSGVLPFSKMGGTIYYSRKEVMKILEDNQKKAA